MQTFKKLPIKVPNMKGMMYITVNSTSSSPWNRYNHGTTYYEEKKPGTHIKSTPSNATINPAGIRMDPIISNGFLALWAAQKPQPVAKRPTIVIRI